MTMYDLTPSPVNIPTPQGGLLAGFAGEASNRLDNRNAASAYNPLLDSIYGAGPKPAPGGFLARIFGGAQPAPSAMPGAGGIGSDAVASARANAAVPQLPANMPPRAALEALLGNPQTRAFANHLLARSQALSGQQAWGGGGWGGGYWGGGASGGAAPAANAYPPRPMPNPLRGAGQSGAYSAADIPTGQVVVQDGVRFRKQPDGSFRRE